jgi:hypothetical protein
VGALDHRAMAFAVSTLAGEARPFGKHEETRIAAGAPGLVHLGLDRDRLRLDLLGAETPRSSRAGSTAQAADLASMSPRRLRAPVPGPARVRQERSFRLRGPAGSEGAARRPRPTEAESTLRPDRSYGGGVTRFDVLAALPRGLLAPPVGHLLDAESDPELQDVVEEAVRLAGSKAGMISLLLPRTQLLRAHHGLPPELARAGATDRDVSFCQLVVRDAAPLRVADADQDPRVPDELVKRFGIRAYLGVPVHVNARAVGSLCVFDEAPRHYDDALEVHLTSLAARASARLDALAREGAPPRQSAQDRLVRVSFAELRNLLTPLLGHLELIRLNAIELGPMVRVLSAKDLDESARGRALDSLLGSVSAFEELCESASAVEQQLGRLHRMLFTLETGLTEPHGSARLDEVLETAAELARHHTRLIGGVELPPRVDVDVHASRVSLVGFIGAALSMIAERARSAGARGAALRVSSSSTDTSVIVNVEAEGLQREDGESVLRSLHGERFEREGIQVAALDQGLRLILPRAR